MKRPDVMLKLLSLVITSRSFDIATLEEAYLAYGGHLGVTREDVQEIAQMTVQQLFDMGKP